MQPDWSVVRVAFEQNILDNGRVSIVRDTLWQNLV